MVTLVLQRASRLNWIKFHRVIVTSQHQSVNSVPRWNHHIFCLMLSVYLSLVCECRHWTMYVPGSCTCWNSSSIELVLTCWNSSSIFCLEILSEEMCILCAYMEAHIFSSGTTWQRYQCKKSLAAHTVFPLDNKPSPLGSGATDARTELYFHSVPNLQCQWATTPTTLWHLSWALIRV